MTQYNAEWDRRLVCAVCPILELLLSLFCANAKLIQHSVSNIFLYWPDQHFKPTRAQAAPRRGGKACLFQEAPRHDCEDGGGLCMHVPCVWACACGRVRLSLDGELIFSMSPSMRVIKEGGEPHVSCLIALGGCKLIGSA